MQNIGSVFSFVSTQAYKAYTSVKESKQFAAVVRGIGSGLAFAQRNAKPLAFAAVGVTAAVGAGILVRTLTKQAQQAKPQGYVEIENTPDLTFPLQHELDQRRTFGGPTQRAETTSSKSAPSAKKQPAVNDDDGFSAVSDDDGDFGTFVDWTD